MSGVPDGPRGVGSPAGAGGSYAAGGPGATRGTAAERVGSTREAGTTREAGSPAGAGGSDATRGTAAGGVGSAREAGSPAGARGPTPARRPAATGARQPSAAPAAATAPAAAAAPAAATAPATPGAPTAPASAGIVDCAVHPAPRRPDDIRAYMREPWRSRPFPGLQRYFYPAPNGDFDPAAGPAPGADPDLVARHVLRERGAEAAILLPLTRGLLPDADLAAAVCAATNDWLAAEWLTRPGFHGSIRVSPSDPAQAAAEIERWAGDPRMVQVAVPLQAHQPYGQRVYAPIWEAAARHRLPVALHIDGGSGVELQSTPVGTASHYVEWSALYPLNFGVHLASFVAEGVFARLPDLRVVFADGGLDMLPPLAWRMDKNWRPTRHETPWVTETPSAYLREHVRFLTHRLEGPADPATRGRWLALAGAADLLMYGSSYPAWDGCDPAAAVAGADASTAARILGGSARAWYRLAPHAAPA